MRETHIQVKSAGFRPDDIKLKIEGKADFGTAKCKERMELIKSYGFEPANNLFLILHEYDSPEAAAAACKLINSFRTGHPILQEEMKDVEMVKADGKTLVVGERATPDFAKSVATLHTQLIAFGDVIHTAHSASFELLNSSTVKDILMTDKSTPIAEALESFFLRFSISHSKELLAKFFDYVENLDPSKNPEEALNEKLGYMVMKCFHHLSLDIDLKEPNELCKNAFKAEIRDFLKGFLTQMKTLAQSLGVLELAKNSGAKTKCYVSLTPCLSLDITIHAPTAVSAVEAYTSA